MLIFPSPGSVEGVVARRFDDGATVNGPIEGKPFVGGAAPAGGGQRILRARAVPVPARRH